MLFSRSVTTDSFVTPWTQRSPSSFSVTGISQARILEWVAICFPEDLPNPGIQPDLLHWQADSLPLSHLGSPQRGIVNKNNTATLPAKEGWVGEGWTGSLGPEDANYYT